MTRRASSNVPVQGDIHARDFRELAERAVLERDGTMALEACAGWAELHRAGYRLTQLTADAGGVAARPVRMRARYDGMCTACGAPIAIDDPIVWTRGEQGVRCAPCGGAS